MIIREIIEKQIEIKKSGNKTLIKMLDDGFNFKECYPKSVQAFEAYKTGLELYFRRAGIADLVNVDNITKTSFRFRGFYTIFQAYLSYVSKHYEIYEKKLESFYSDSKGLEDAIEKLEKDFEKDINYSKEELETQKERHRDKSFEYTGGSLVGLRVFDLYRKRLPLQYSVRLGIDLVLDTTLEIQIREQKEKLINILEQQEKLFVKEETYESAARIRKMIEKITKY